MTHTLRTRTPAVVAFPKQKSTVYAQAKEAGTVRIDADRNNLILSGPGGLEQGIAFSLTDGIVPFPDWIGPMYAVSDIDAGMLCEFVVTGDIPS